MTTDTFLLIATKVECIGKIEDIPIYKLVHVDAATLNVRNQLIMSHLTPALASLNNILRM